MKKLIVLGLLIGFIAVRRRMLDASDRRNGFGAYAPLSPTPKHGSPQRST